MDGTKSCRYCGKDIYVGRGIMAGKWRHVSNGSVYCDQTATVKAAP